MLNLSAAVGYNNGHHWSGSFKVA